MIRWTWLMDSVYSRALDGTKTVSISRSTLTIAGGGVTLKFRPS
jgi:hypothetical protein